MSSHDLQYHHLFLPLPLFSFQFSFALYSCHQVRRMMAKLEAMDADPSRQGRSASDAEIAAERAKDPISAKDLAEALQATRPSAQRFEQRYVDWQRDFGAV